VQAGRAEPGIEFRFVERDVVEIMGETRLVQQALI